MEWNEYFFRLTDTIKSKSKDLTTQFGCVIIGPDNEIRSTGYNSFPRKLIDDLPERHIRPEKYIWFEHAERNAIYNAARMGTPLKGCRLYVGAIPCSDCARGVIQSGIIRVVYDEQSWQAYLDKQQRIAEEKIAVGEEPDVTWLHSVEKSIQMFKECGVELESYNRR